MFCIVFWMWLYGWCMLGSMLEVCLGLYDSYIVGFFYNIFLWLLEIDCVD